jgi:tape measure domain-containing protein
MAKIREELILYDKFTNTFTSYIRQTSEAMTKTRQAQNTVNEFAQSQRSATRAANSLTGSIRNLAGAFVGLQGIRTLFGWSDQMTASRARLDMMNDGLQTTKELQDMIFQSAMRARGSYMETMGFVAKLGTLAGNAFSSNQEIVAFAEQINKQMVLSGTHTWEAQAAMLQLTQGLASGVLRGEELNSVLEQTPMIAQTIAKYMGVTTGEMREMASQGLVTAEVVKNAMFWAADETNAAFENMPLTWAQAWTMAQNIAIRALNPVLLAIGFLANNIQIIGPLVLGLGAAFAVFQIAANWTKIATAATTAYHFAVNLLSIGFGVLRGSTAAASAAVFTFNSALLASPITWIVLIVLLLVAALYAGVAAFNKFADASVSATGVIAGVLAILAAFCYNSVIVPIQNYFAAAANFIGNVFHDPVTAVKVLFYDMALTVLGYIQKMAQGIEDLINEIPGVKVNITSAIDNLYGTMSANREAAIAAGSYKEFIKPLEYQDYSAAYQSGYNFGRDLEGKAASWFSGGAGLSSPAGIDASGMAGDVGNIAKGVSDINKAVNMSEEDIRSLVDVAERRYVNHINLTSQTPVITINGQNTGNTAADRQNLADAIRDILIEQVASGSVRSTARA